MNRYKDECHFHMIFVINLSMEDNNTMLVIKQILYIKIKHLYQITLCINKLIVCLMVINATFNNISVISWRK